MSATTKKTAAPEAIKTPLDLAGLLAHLSEQAQPHIGEAHAQWFAKTPAMADCIGSQAASLCNILAELDPLHPHDHANAFHLLGNVFSLLAGLAAVGDQMTRTHQRLKAEREGGAV